MKAEASNYPLNGDSATVFNGMTAPMPETDS